MAEIKKALTKEHGFPKNYSDEFLILDKGEGVYVFDVAGKRYLDFGSGIAVNALGYGNKEIAAIASAQMEKLVHVSNLFTTEPALKFASKLVDGKRFSAVHFGNSGSEANEAAIKYAKLWSIRTKGPECYKILSFSGAFHGRTMGALASTYNNKYKEPFGPMIPGAEIIEYNNVEKLKESLNESFAAVIVEVVQGEGGLRSLSKEFVSALNDICRKHKVLIIADEVQTGMGRTGDLFACDGVGLDADIITLSKPLAGGLPLSATLIPDYVNEKVKVGEHGTTFGGGPVTTAVASYVWDMITGEGFLEGVKEKSAFLTGKLEDLKNKYSFIKEIRGKGLLLGLEIDENDRVDVLKIMGEARDKGLLLLKTGVNVLRLAPPLVISQDEIEEGIAILDSVLKELKQKL
ncbi:aspartate aminotransferase family protein [Spirochaeta isovalerica]|uniref:Acetylornithine/N-succinyldiaminopimelate aminotransferase n=1 Tax=Spirochaeta isovalerica TaxID=150 RepID=A0A841RET7_9SPIO|nr:aspartate aminotransferase family protein [Spirochaeta isovalerica]MBB6482503.1 acetylornithine/N-succinyldiaminopimelate aminotransferase [Spirochaeta isovalerica]